MKKILAFLIIITNFHIYSQYLVDTGSLIQGGVEDGSKLVEAYIKPLNKAIVYGLSDVNYSKIKREDDYHLEINIKAAYISIPGDDWTFDVTKLNLKDFEPKDPGDIMAQTVFGDSLKSITLVSKAKNMLGEPLIEFDMPTGSQKSAMPLPFAGITLRLKHTNLSFNFIPYVSVPDSDFKIGMLGGAIQQDLAPFIKSLQDKAFGISLQAGGAYLLGNSQLDIKPGQIYTPVTITGHTTGPYDNQEINIVYTSLNFAAYFDYSLGKHINIFAGAGFNSGTSNIKVEGTYPVYMADPAGFGSVVAEDIEDPLDIKNNFNRAVVDFGIRGDWKHLFFQINYSPVTYGGLGFNLGYKML